jgi:hypothetical protein
MKNYLFITILKTCECSSESSYLLTSPLMLIQTATNLDRVKRSPRFDGKRAANISVNKLDVEDRTVTMPASVSAKAV